MEQRQKKKNKKRETIRTVLFALVVLLLVFGAVTALLYRDRLTPSGLNQTFSDSGSEVKEVESDPFTYESGSMQSFAAFGNNLAVASSTGYQMLDAKGRTVSREVLSMDAPAVSVSENWCVIYDADGQELRVLDVNGATKSLKTTDRILSARINANGYLAVVTEETGYKAAVTVYDNELRRIFVWHSGAAYVIAAEIDPNNEMLATLSVDAEGGKLTVFALDKEQPLGSFTSEGELFWDLHWMDKAYVCLLSEERLVFTNEKAEVLAEYGYQGRYLLDYDLENCAALLLGDHRSGGNSLLVTVATDGRERGSVELQQEVYSLDLRGGKVLALYADKLELMTDQLGVLGSTEEILGVKKALLRKDGKSLLLGAYAAELIGLY